MIARWTSVSRCLNQNLPFNCSVRAEMWPVLIILGEDFWRWYRPSQ